MARALLLGDGVDPGCLFPKEDAMKTLFGALLVSMVLSTPATAAEPAKIIAPPQCQTDADCGACSACVGNLCQGFGVLECTVDTDCGVDEYCQVDDADSCKNHCVSKQCMLVFCMQECDPWYGPACGDGLVCEQTIKGCCGQCVKPAPVCVSDADCDPCSACVDGACIALPMVPACNADTDCGADEYCITYPGAECRNRCASKTCWVVDCMGDCEPVVNPCGAGQACVEPIPGCCGQCQPANPACVTNADCGSCQVCVNGQCEGLGVVECFDDADCLGDFRCQTYPDQACKNHCVDPTCDLVDCTAECDPYFTPCPAGQVCVEPIEGCCGQCQEAECASDVDCGACAVCVGGSCMGLGDISCEADSDCSAGETCVVDPANPCANHCETVQTCAVDYDCQPCQACIDGVCLSLAPTGCLVDADCAAGEVCVQGLPGECENHCQPAELPCADDSDCGACQACVDGQCMGLGVVECTAHADCAADEYCHQVLGEPCKNACEPLPEGGCRADADCGAGDQCVMLPDGSGLGDCVATSCASDADCGACGVCVNGTCEGTGLVVCTEDGDCGAGKRCEIDAEAPCMNACVPAGVEPDATTGDSTSPDTVESDAGSDAVEGDTTKEPTDDKTGAGDCSFSGFDRSSGSTLLLAGALLLGLALRRRWVA